MEGKSLTKPAYILKRKITLEDELHGMQDRLEIDTVGNDLGSGPTSSAIIKFQWECSWKVYALGR